MNIKENNISHCFQIHEIKIVMTPISCLWDTIVMELASLCILQLNFVSFFPTKSRLCSVAMFKLSAALLSQFALVSEGEGISTSLIYDNIASSQQYCNTRTDNVRNIVKKESLKLECFKLCMASCKIS